ncbi:MAG: hypothetical protein JO290_05130 [Sphingomonadaceae bacterium]|nr:hypothetical protein [Sphingomonadaceae bacterium]
MSSSSVTTNPDGSVTVTSDDGGDVSTVTTPTTPQVPALPPVQHRGMIHLGPDGAYVHSGKPLDPGSFFAGLVVGVFLLVAARAVRRWLARRDAEGTARAAAIGPQDRTAAEIAALARRTAALETIVTDPAHRTAQAIDALR